ncbi:hypothetical protein CRYUN_Cryun02cG0210000 [Craigia yunnanensis]
MSLKYQAPYAEISQTKHYSYQLAVNVAMDQPAGFNQFMEAAESPTMPNQNLRNPFGSDLNNGNNRNPM